MIERAKKMSKEVDLLTKEAYKLWEEVRNSKPRDDEILEKVDAMRGALLEADREQLVK